MHSVHIKIIEAVLFFTVLAADTDFVVGSTHGIVFNVL
jgi:hypothetical protein